MTVDPSDRDTGSDKWDWSTVVTAVVLIALLLVLTMELWLPHPFETHSR